MQIGYGHLTWQVVPACSLYCLIECISGRLYQGLSHVVHEKSQSLAVLTLELT